MNILIFVWNTIFYHPIVNLIVFLYKYMGGNLGIAIILVTILIRLLLWPFMQSQIESMKKIQGMKPKLDELKKKYKNDKKKYQEEQLKLYRESGANPAGSCLPLLIQFPFIIALYSVIRIISTSKSASVFNNIVYSSALKLPEAAKINAHFLGIDLAKDAASIGFHNIVAALPYVGIAILVGITQFWASKVSMPMNVEDTTEAVEMLEGTRKGKKKQPAEKEESMIDPEAFSKNLSTQMLYIFPVILVWISLGFSGNIPSGLSIYWIVQSLFVVFQTLIMQDKLPWKIRK